MKVRKTSIPADSLIRNYLPADYSDTYVCKTRGENITAQKLQVSFWTDMPILVKKLFALRNALVKPFGLETDKGNMGELRKCLENGGSYNITTVVERRENEMIICLTDKHPKAYMSVYVSNENEDEKQAFVITLVHYHNWLGRAYFFFVRPFHGIVVKSMLKHKLKKMENKPEWRK